MTHDHDSHGHAPPVEFSDEEWQALRTEDAKGAAAVVGLMVGIFTIGLILYLIVAMSASA